MSEKEEALLAQIVDLFAQRFGRKAVLRGGMVLRLLGCPRLTNDLDYLFVPFASKHEITQDVVDTLARIPGATVAHSLNSQCLRAAVTVAGTSVQVEAKVAMDAPVVIVSTREMARAFAYPPRLIPVLEHSVALAHKMAAWNERRLVRDLHDIWFFLRMGIRPAPAILEARLRSPRYSRLVARHERFAGTTCEEFYGFLREMAAALTDADIAAALADCLPPEELPGLAMSIRAELAMLR